MYAELHFKYYITGRESDQYLTSRSWYVKYCCIFLLV